MEKDQLKPAYVIKKCRVCGLDRLIRRKARLCDECKTTTQEINRKNRLDYTRAYRLRPEYRKKRNAQVRAKLKNNPHLRLIKLIRGRIYLFFRNRGKTKIASTKKILGCDYATLRNHIESKFQPGMTWENMGEWHIDHEKPLAKAKTRSEILDFNHYSNLQPMWAVDNLKKGTKWRCSPKRSSLITAG